MISHQVSNSYGNYNYNAYIHTGTTFKPHFHGNYELIYSKENNTVVTINNNSTVLSQGELILISPYSVHSLVIPDTSKTWIGVFSSDYIQVFANNTRLCSFSKFTCSGSIEEFLNAHLFFEGQPDQYLNIACLNLVCNECVKHAALISEKEDRKFMYSVIEYISDNLCEDFSMSDIAKALNYEYHYFSSLFNKIFAMNFKSFINNFRFETACRELISTEDSITDICDKSGFGSIRNFNRVFKHHCGLTPNEYRKEFLINKK